MMKFKYLLNTTKNLFLNENSINNKLKILIFYILFPVFIILLTILIFLFNRMQSNISQDISLQSSNIISNYKSKVKTSFTIAKLVSQTPDIVDNAEIRQVNHIIQTLKVYKEELNIPYTSVHDLKGYSLGKGHDSEILLRNDINIPYVKLGITTRRKTTGLITMTPEGLAVLSVLPIYSKNDKTRFIGIASAGYLFNNSFAKLLKGDNNAHVIFFYNNKITGTTTKTGPKEFINIKSELAQSVKENNNIVLRINGLSHEAHFFKIGKGSHSLYIIIAVNIFKERIYFWITFFLIILGVILGLFVSITLSRKLSLKITGPINNLVEISNMVSNGNLSVRADVQSNDELEVLSDTFNYMIKNIEEKQKIIISNFNNAIQIINKMIAHSSTRLYEFTRHVTKVSVLLAKELNLAFENVWNIEMAALVHDLGMIGLSESLAYSKRALTEQENEYVKNHVNRSIEIIKNLPDTGDIIKIISEHHERYQGQGYPHSLTGRDIGIGAKIIGICDDFIHMTKDIRYQTTDKKERIINELEERSGVYYDPKIVKALINIINKEELIYIVNEDDIKFQDKGNIFYWEIPTNINLEQVIVARIISRIEKFGADEEELFKLDFSISEIIRNAMVHGNKYDETKTVFITLTIENMKEGHKKIVIKVKDQGEGMDVREHNRFSESRKHISNIMRTIEEFEAKNDLNKDPDFIKIKAKIKNFKYEYYSDYNTFKQFDEGDLSGGLGLVQVKNSFDNVAFVNIIKDNKVNGLEVTLEKII